MRVLKQKTYEFTISETRTFSVLGSGHSKFEAEQDAVERFHQQTKHKTLQLETVGRPRVVRCRSNS